MEPKADFPERIQWIIARYLRGETPFDAAADEIAGILARLMKAAPATAPRQPGAPIKIRPLTAAEWTNPRVIDAPTAGVLHAAVAPGWNSEEQGKVHSLMEEAVRRSKSAGGGRDPDA